MAEHACKAMAKAQTAQTTTAAAARIRINNIAKMNNTMEINWNVTNSNWTKYAMWCSRLEFIGDGMRNKPKTRNTTTTKLNQRYTSSMAGSWATLKSVYSFQYLYAQSVFVI